MFKFLKDKLKDSISKISKKVEEEGETEEKPESPIEEEPKKGFFAKLKERFTKKESPEEAVPEEEGYEEVDVKSEIKEAEKAKEIQEKKQEIRQEDERIHEKIEKKETPTIQQLTERKEKTEELKKAEKPKKPEEPVIKEPEHIEKKQETAEIKEPKKEEPKEQIAEEPKKGFFGAIKHKIITKKISQRQFEDMFWDLEIALLENNVAVEVIEKIKSDLNDNIVDKPILRSRVEKIISKTLKDSISSLFKSDKFDLLKRISEKKPFVICFVGINGSGKTTSIAKVVKLLQNNDISCVLAASDTFRAASIEQLQKHADNLGVKLIKHDYNSDPAAVAFDAIQHAKSKNIDVVLIDTAGRMHSNANLTDEMKKIIRVAKPDLKIFVGESITGNDCVEQAKKFNEAISLDAIILSKADVDEKGGAAVSVSFVTGKPIIYIGTGQNYEDLKEFDSGIVMNSLGLEG